MNLGQRIRQARTARKLSLQRVADALGVSKQAVYQWELGTSDARKHIGELSRLLNYPPEYFHDGEDMASSQDQLENQIARLTAENRAVVQTMVAAMLAAQAPHRRKKVR